VFDPVIPPQYYAWDGIHLTVEGHAWIAASLLPQVMATLRQAAKTQTGAPAEPKH
jgi:acyl-CoA thioesterase-1